MQCREMRERLKSLSEDEHNKQYPSCVSATSCMSVNSKASEILYIICLQKKSFSHFLDRKLDGSMSQKMILKVYPVSRYHTWLFGAREWDGIKCNWVAN